MCYPLLPGVMVIYVIVEKSAIPARSGLHTDHAIFYNYAAGLVMERILLAARDWPGGSRDAVVRFGHVRHFGRLPISQTLILCHLRHSGVNSEFKLGR